MTEKEVVSSTGEDVEEASQEDVVFVKSSEFTLEKWKGSIRYNVFGNVEERGMFYAGRSRFQKLVDEDEEELTGISVSDIRDDDDEDERQKWFNLTNEGKGPCLRTDRRWGRT